MSDGDKNEFVGSGKLFATEEEEFAEYIELMEWATQAPPEAVEALIEALQAEMRRRTE